MQMTRTILLAALAACLSPFVNAQDQTYADCLVKVGSTWG